jgi:hypothetical protein
VCFLFSPQQREHWYHLLLATCDMHVRQTLWRNGLEGLCVCTSIFENWLFSQAAPVNGCYACSLSTASPMVCAIRLTNLTPLLQTFVRIVSRRLPKGNPQRLFSTAMRTSRAGRNGTSAPNWLQRHRKSNPNVVFVTKRCAILRRRLSSRG